MANKEKFEPKDSAEEKKKADQVVKPRDEDTYKRQDADLRNPEKKRKYSEQPPTKHNSKT